jgi:RIO kinase 1
VRHNETNLIDPAFTRGSLALAEQNFILEQFGGPVICVLGKINDGKEATVYACEGVAGEQLAAKIYRARKFRAFRNERQYAASRAVRDRRLAKAMQQRSRKGNTDGQRLWVENEWRILNELKAAGVSVPTPVAHSSAGILMELIGEWQRPAPRLIEANLERAELTIAQRALVMDVERMLSVGIVHGDLSPYNVLWHAARPRIIDLPQAVAIDTPDAMVYLQRDLGNLARYFERGGVGSEALFELLSRIRW